MRCGPERSVGPYRMASERFTNILRTWIEVLLDVIFSYSLIKKNNVIPVNKIWISFGMNDLNYDVDRSKDIYFMFPSRLLNIQYVSTRDTMTYVKIC